MRDDATWQSRAGAARGSIPLAALLILLSLILPGCREAAAPGSGGPAASGKPVTDDYIPLAPLMEMTAGPLLDIAPGQTLKPRLLHSAERRGDETILTGRVIRREWYGYDLENGPRAATHPAGAPGMIRLEKEDLGRTFLMTGHINMAEVDLVALEVQCETPGLLEFVWDNEALPLGELERSHLFGLDGRPGTREYLVPVHEMPNWIGKARWFGIRVVELDQPAVIHAVRFLQAGPEVRQAMRRSRDETPAPRLVLAEESRPAFNAPAGTVYEAGLTVPENARLHTGFGYFPDVWRKQRRGVIFRVEALTEGGGESRRLLETFLDPGDWIGSRRWQDEQLDLEGLAGQQVTLRFSTLLPESGEGDGEGPAPGPLDNFAAWSPPALVVDGSHTLEQRRNVIVWLVDALRADRLSAYGAARRTLPCLDRLVREGLIFTRPLAQASWTAASTGSIFTSLYPSRHGAEREKQRLLPDCVTLAERLEGAGIYTMGLVANGHVKSLMNFDQGFDRYAFLRGRGDPPHADASQIIERLRPMLEQNVDKPFYLYVHSVDPHGPYTPPPPYDTLFTPAGYQGTIDGSYEPHDFRGRPLDRVSEDDLAQLIGLYDGEIAWSDLHLGMLVAELQRLGLLEKTLILVTGDHGEEFLDHGGWDHAKTLFNEQLQVPLAGRLPESARQTHPAGSVIHQPAQLVDIYPSVLDFLGVPSDKDQLSELEGRSFLTAGDGGLGRPAERLIFSEENKAEHQLFSVERGRYKLIRRLKPEAGTELYDLLSDPGETQNIAAEHPELVGRMTGAGEAIRSRRSLERDEVALDQATREELRALGYIE